jgi:translation elongation factor EF-G
VIVDRMLREFKVQANVGRPQVSYREAIRKAVRAEGRFVRQTGGKGTPEDFMGDVIGNLNSKRGQIDGLDERGSSRVIRAHVPLAEMFGYATELRSMTQGRAAYSMEFSRYAEVPTSLANELIAKSKS